MKPTSLFTLFVLFLILDLSFGENCLYDKHTYGGTSPYLGGTLAHDSKIREPLKCRAACLKVPGADYWQLYYAVKGNQKSIWAGCYCGHKAGATESKAGPDDEVVGGYIVGPPAPPPFPKRCYKKNRNYPGHNLVETAIISWTAQQCQQECEKNEKCVAWTWDSKSAHCWPKSAAPEMRHLDNSYSGLKDCITAKHVSEAPKSCFRDAFTYGGTSPYLGGTLFHNSKIRKPLKCKAACEKVAGADYWQFYFAVGGDTHSIWAGCYCGHKAGAVKSKAGPNDEVIGGPVVGPPPPAPPSKDCYKKNSNYPGHNLVDTAIISWTAQQCQEECEKMDKCVAFTWDSKSAHCWPKNGAPDTHHLENSYSGLKNCKDCFSHLYDEYSQGGTATYLGGTLFHDHKINKPLACVAACQKVPGANYWQFFYTVGGKFHNYWGGCYCGHKKGATKTKVKAGQRLIGGPVVAPAAPAPPPKDCYKKDRNYPGNNLVSTAIIAWTAQQCQEACQKMDKCAAWTWDKNSAHCWPKSAAPKMRHIDNSYSGTKDC